MRQSTRLIINSLSMLGRMSLTIGISLLITRLLLRSLGKVDFGLMLALGATGALLQFASSALTIGMQRQLTSEIARGDKQAISRVFSTGWVVFVTMGIGLWLVGVALTGVVLAVLNIPADRADAAWWVYQLSLLNLVLVVTATPYQALIVSHQHLTIQAVADVVMACLRFAAVLLLFVVPWDRLVTFVALQLACYAIVRTALNSYCLWKYEGSFPRLRHFDRTQLKQIFGIAAWSLLSQLSWRIRMQGGILVISAFFEPAVNAGYGVATQLANYAATLSYSIQQSVLPALVGAHAKGNRASVHRLALVAGKYTVLLLCFVVVPIELETDLVLQIWLGELPPYSVVFTRLVLIWPLINMFTYGFTLANVATGDLGWYTMRLLASSILVLLVAGIGFYLGLPPWILPALGILSSLVMAAVAVIGLGALIELPPSRWVYESLLPTLGVLVPSVAVAGAVHWGMADGIWRLAAVVGVYAAVASPLIWLIGIASWERASMLKFASSALGRLQNASQARPHS